MSSAMNGRPANDIGLARPSQIMFMRAKKKQHEDPGGSGQLCAKSARNTGAARISVRCAT